MITADAARWIVRLLEDEGKSPSEWGFRLGLKAGGCSGFLYQMRFDRPSENDHVFEQNGAKVLVDPKSFPLLDGSILHYKTGLQNAGFSVINPKAVSACGCGASVALKPPSAVSSAAPSSQPAS